MKTIVPSSTYRDVPCFHGGAFFSAIGDRFDALERSEQVINADVLDAWFAPSPKVTKALQDYLPWILRTSPPIDAAGFIETVSEVRGVPAHCLLPGAGSSDLIFRAFNHWLDSSSRVLILDPIYSEYPHVLSNVVGCCVERFVLSREDNYIVDLQELQRRVAVGNYDLVVLVNPNSPTGQFIPREMLIPFLKAVPPNTRVWIDEAYLDYLGADQSIEDFASRSRNVIVCKSMSKVYALSGTRIAYLCATPETIRELRVLTPPWIVSLPAQIAGVQALADPEYYRERYRDTHKLRADLALTLISFGWTIVPGCANFLLCHLPEAGPAAEAIIAGCRERDLFLRNPGNMGSSFGTHTLRVAVKDHATNQRMSEILKHVLTIS
ncbi:MAG: Aminotransferase [Verrucomicrobiales bacterium]|nr:Aminotransferase [Verrucomicrobiales bacterium]